MKKVTILILGMILSISFLAAQGTWTVINTGNSTIPSDQIISLGMGNNMQVFLGTPGGLVAPSHVYIYNGTSYDELAWLSSFNELEASSLGYVSIANSSGVYHFDGTNYTLFNTDNSGLTANGISCIDVAPDGSEYVGMGAAGLLFEGGLGIYNGSVWTSYNQSASTLPVDDVLSVLKSQNGPVYIGTGSGGLVTKDGDVWTTYNTGNSNIPGDTPIYIEENSEGMAWIAFQNGSIATFDGQNFVIIKDPLSKDFPNAIVTTMLFDENQTLWVGFANAGLGEYDGTDWTFYTSADSGLPDDDVTGLGLDADGNIWISTNGGGIAILEPETTFNESLDCTEMNIYPNPVESTLNLMLQEIPLNAEVAIYDINGREMFSTHITEKNQKIDCRSLNSGQYIIKLVNENKGLIGSMPFMKK
ncbi:MAG: T9SS type A sorting domain-containing protein [Bacteroidales bacterium]|jgi:hypothetical protein|nr:T9SS type A sorting domain-containing protein [Bacteroidales bacterium]